MTKVKVCGITSYENALQVAQLGVDMLGLNFHKPSPRYITPDDAQAICTKLRSELSDACPVLVGVFVNVSVDEVTRILDHAELDFAQLSGDESEAMLAELKGRAYKAIRPMNQNMALDDTTYYAPHAPEDERVPSLLLDAYHPKLFGGTGESASVDVALAVNSYVPRLMLAGGLTPENVGERVAAIQPWGVDVASGVEDDVPGMKSLDKVRAFVAAAKGVEVTGG
jgi:phosphoribosylanthranilate isomerase